MIFWIILALMAAGIAMIVATDRCCDKHRCGEKEYSKFVDFVWRNDDFIKLICGVISTIFGLAVFFMLIVIIPTQASAGGARASNEQRYNALVYKAQTETIRDEFGIVNKEYIDEVQAWNEYLAKYQSYSHNFWIGIFYPKRQYDGFEFIDLESIKVKE